MNPDCLPPRPPVAAGRLLRLSDEQLAALIFRGHEAAFEALVARHRPALVRHCTRLLGGADAEEAVQDALLRAYVALSRGRSVDHVRGWLWMIAHNRALNLLRSRPA